MKLEASLWLVSVLLLSGCAAPAQNVASDGPPGPWHAPRAVEEGDWDSHHKEPFQLFDNVYYVGTQRVSAYLLETPEGLALIDATHPETADFVLENIRTLGFDPADVEYVFITHGHADHYGGAARIQAETGARVGMSAADWALVEQRSAEGGGGPLERDLVLEDDDVIVLGGHAIRFLVTPGHTPGSLSMEYIAQAPRTSFRVLTPGGLGLNFGPEGTPAYLESVERMRGVEPSVILANHPYMGPVDLFEAEPEIQDLEHSHFHPLAGRPMIEEWFDALETAALEKLEEERTDD